MKWVTAFKQDVYNVFITLVLMPVSTGNAYFLIGSTGAVDSHNEDVVL